MFKKIFPEQQSANDATFTPKGIRLSHHFIRRERLQNFQYVWVFVDEEKKQIGFRFLLGPAPQAIKLTESGSNTSGKTLSCAPLKKCPWIREIMDNKNIGMRRFKIRTFKLETIERKSTNGDYVTHIINLNRT